MRILFTGGSSFTGLWFVSQLAQAGHDVAVVLRSPPDRYEAVRRERVERVSEQASTVHLCTFGDDRFLSLCAAGWDVMCHHAAETEGYRSADFDFSAALAANTRRLPAVIDAFVAGGGQSVVLTGSVFEADEGTGSSNRAFSAYGLSKTLTFQAFRFYCEIANVRLGKFVIPNPFGPHEDIRFTSYLARSWSEGTTPVVATPEYVRDNIHVSLLARAYAAFVEGLAASDGFVRTNPSGYRERQGDFALRFAGEMERRLPIPCPLEIGTQQDFSEPLVRTNTDDLDPIALGWNEEEAWDALADYYSVRFLQSSVR